LTWCQKFALQMFPKGGDADFCPQKNVFLGLVWAILAIRKLFLCLLRGVRFLLANRTPPSSTSETFSNLPAWEVSLEPGGQSPISQEFHVHPPTIDTLETGITRSVAPNKHLLEGWGHYPNTIRGGLPRSRSPCKQPCFSASLQGD